MDTPILFWILFNAFVLLMLALVNIPDKLGQ